MRSLGRLASVPKTGHWVCQRCLRERRNLSSETVNSTMGPLSLLILRGVRPQHFKKINTAVRFSTKEKSRVPAGIRARTTLKGGRRPAILTAVIGVFLVFAFSDTAQHCYAAAKRSLRVADALIRSVRE